MSALLAATLLAVILVGMGVLRRSAMVAGSLGLAVALMLAATTFDLADGPSGNEIRAVFGAFAEAIHSTATILWIILTALSIYEFQRRAGATERIRDTLAALTDDRRIQAILIAWFFGLFMEGAAGFGTPVALAAPLLVGLGYAPVKAVALALLGHAAGVSFGAVGTPVLAQIELTGLDLAGRTAVLHAVAGPILLLLMVRLAGDAPLSRSDLVWTALAALCFFGPSLALAYFTGPELPTLGGALLGSAGFVIFLRRRRPSLKQDLRRLRPDLMPYLLILLFVLATRLISPLQQLQQSLSGVALAWSLGETFRGTFQPLYHPGTVLFLGFFAGAFVTGRGGLVGVALAAALRRLFPVALALLVMLALSRIMVHSGMIAELASAASGADPAWPMVVPLIGVLSTFITGSATASNILFTELQLSTAASLSLPPLAMAAAQGFGAAIGNVIAPHNIIAGSATVGLVGREGEILAHTARPCALYAGIGGVTVFSVLLWT